MAKEYKNIQSTNFRVSLNDEYDTQTRALAESFYDTCEGLNISWNNCDYREAVFQACIAFFVLIQNVHFDNQVVGQISEDQLVRVKGIVEEIEKTVKLLEVVKDNPDLSVKKILNKLFLIYEAIGSNFIRDKRFPLNNIMGKIFNDYRSLFLIVDLINKYYNDLLQIDFSTASFLKPFADVIAFRQMNGYALTEEEKLNLFFGLLNGDMRFTYDIEPINHNLKMSSVGNEPISISKLYFPKTNHGFKILDGTPIEGVIKEYKLEK